MAADRLSLFHYDLVRELCDSCRRERFHFVPVGTEPATGPCKVCGAHSKLADISDSAVWRLMTGPSGEVVVVPVLSF